MDIDGIISICGASLAIVIAICFFAHETIIDYKKLDVQKISCENK